MTLVDFILCEIWFKIENMVDAIEVDEKLLINSNIRSHNFNIIIILINLIEESFNKISQRFNLFFIAM